MPNATLLPKCGAFNSVRHMYAAILECYDIAGWKTDSRTVKIELAKCCNRRLYKVSWRHAVLSTV